MHDSLFLLSAVADGVAAAALLGVLHALYYPRKRSLFTRILARFKRPRRERFYYRAIAFLVVSLAFSILSIAGAFLHQVPDIVPLLSQVMSKVVLALFILYLVHATMTMRS